MLRCVAVAVSQRLLPIFVPADGAASSAAVPFLPSSFSFFSCLSFPSTASCERGRPVKVAAALLFSAVPRCRGTLSCNSARFRRRRRHSV